MCFYIFCSSYMSAYEQPIFKVDIPPPIIQLISGGVGTRILKISTKSQDISTTYMKKHMFAHPPFSWVNYPVDGCVGEIPPWPSEQNS